MTELGTPAAARVHWYANRGKTPPMVASGAKATIGRYKQVSGDGLRQRKGARRTTDVALAVQVLNRRPELGRPIFIRIA
jgi:hypothetical protein